MISRRRAKTFVSCCNLSPISMSSEWHAADARPALAGPGGAGAKGLDGKVITVYSPKGGAGCTMLATNLALALHTTDNKVIIVDANLQFGDVGVFLNLQGKYSLVSLAERAD